MENVTWASIEAKLEILLERKLSEHFAKKNDPFSEYPETMTRKQAAQLLRLDSLQTLDSWAKEGRIKRYHIGRKVYFLKSELIVSMKEKGKYSRI